MKTYIVKYITKDDRSAQDRVRAISAEDAERQVKPHAYRILEVIECDH